MLKNITRLIDVKSIVTITLTMVLTIIILRKIQIQDNVFQLFSSALMLVLGFFFGKKESKGDE